MTRPILIQIIAGVLMLAAGAAVAFTQSQDVWRVVGALVSTLGVILVRRAIRRMRRG